MGTLKFVQLQNFTKKLKWPKLGPRPPDVSVFGPEFQNTILTFEINTLKFVELQIFVKR